jgi:hypothetical protein
MTEIRIARNWHAECVEPSEVERLTERATSSIFYTGDLTHQQVDANRRVPLLAREVSFQAARAGHQHLAAAFAGDRLAGFMIATASPSPLS